MPFRFRLDENGHPVQIATLGTARKVTIGASTNPSAALTSDAVRVTPTVDCFIEVGAAPEATTNSHFLSGGVPIEIDAGEGNKIAVLQVSSGGTLYISEIS